MIWRPMRNWFKKRRTTGDTSTKAYKYACVKERVCTIVSKSSNNKNLIKNKIRIRIKYRQRIIQQYLIQILHSKLYATKFKYLLLKFIFPSSMHLCGVIVLTYLLAFISYALFWFPLVFNKNLFRIFISLFIHCLLSNHLQKKI